ncbi:hypothetical protein H257_05557 [Aphanomyces astaci]|uniref:Uncharacterized protein n=1 Tax=Aphanomyces astaci TaxID=112090 RepID=W4GQM2_APHAT|nr:hypothetical protein H257_05557 [Aphanomyces astaci]ETV82030.1 hypothetical protein H257_05557 [Aphanomyces astaci]|eukprot:XP_009828767.1 hypothetical protein H257_05557 [Aphanomyces astaci]
MLCLGHARASDSLPSRTISPKQHSDGGSRTRPATWRKRPMVRGQLFMAKDAWNLSSSQATWSHSWSPCGTVNTSSRLHIWSPG